VIFRFSVLAVAALLLAGCQEKQPNAPRAGSYGSLSNAPQTVARARPDRSSAQPWTNAGLSIIETELSPATLVHSTSKSLSFFANMPETGLGAPTFASIETQQGPKIFRPGDAIDPARMRESWFVVWWAGATNWKDFDSPWFLTLQHRPQKIQFDTNGLHFTFANEAGFAALMPLYGIYIPLQAGHETSPFATLKQKKKRVLTWEWHLALPADPLARAMYWASALKEFPLYCEDSVSLDRAHDAAVVKQKIRFLSWNDDWNTRHLKLAPISPVLALALREGLPVKFSKKPEDMQIFTPFGPYYGLEGVDEYTVTLPVLGFVNETAGTGTTALSNAPCFQAWQTAHASGAWEPVRARWPALRERLERRIASSSWAAFGSTSATPLENSAEALGAARIAYRLGEFDAYADASQFFARSLVQLCAQRRGLNYFRENQPWKSMDPIATNAALTRLSAFGWELGVEIAPPNASTMPDIARLWLASGPEQRLPSSHSTVKLERLIPGGEPAPFAPDLERHAAGPNTFLVRRVRVERDGWPRVEWVDWKTSTGAPWNFGEIQGAAARPQSRDPEPLNWNTHVIRRAAP